MSVRDPIRVIYAKLTSTGSYDVVAMTPNIMLEQARATAEGLRLGDVPSDASFSAAIAYLRPREGGHLVARFTPYPWRDADGREPLMTDLVWVSDEDFVRVRCNAFALVPRNERTFATLETLPPVELPQVSNDGELQRIAELAPRARNFTTFAAAALSTDRLLVVEPEPAENIELLTLLLPPRLRERLTFQTRAYDLPSPVPRITVADRFRAALQRGNWERVIPDDAELPATVASRLADYAAAPAALFRAHELYARITAIGDNLGVEAVRLVRLADFADKLDQGLAMDAVRQISKAEPAEAKVALAELESRLEARQIAEVLTALLERESADLVVERFLEHARAASAASLQSWCAAAADVLLGAQRNAEPRLIALVTTQLAQAGDAQRVLALLTRFRRELAGATPTLPASTPAALRAYFVAQLGRSRTRAVSAAARVIAAAADLHPQLPTQAGQHHLAEAAEEAVHAALEALTLTADDVRALRELQDAIDAVPASVRWIYEFSAQLLTGRFLEYARTDAEVDAAVKRTAGMVTPEALAAFAASLLVAAAQKGPAANRSVRGARTAIQMLGSSALAQRLPAVLEQLGVRQLTLWELPGLEEVLPLLGESARAAGDTRRLALALNRLHKEPSAIGDVADAVLQLRASGTRLTNDTKVLDPILSALASAVPDPAATEIALELVATIADPAALRTIENAVLNSATGVSIRLRRLDRAVLQCQAACDETVYDALVRSLEGHHHDLSIDARQRLRQALGVKSLQYRVSQGIETVLNRRRA
ncbi:MAG TPA: hypothetical protein VK864_01625 [Longimicrobiales bacterium]|nr:hypothetical protein [Longimicrobiales bacterium]